MNLSLINPKEVTVRAYRLDRTRQMLARHGMDAAILFDPLNLRYATGCRNMQVWTAHHFSRYVFVPVVGPVVLFDYGGAMHLSDNLETISETRPARSWDYFGSGERSFEHAGAWANEVTDLLYETCGSGAVLGIDRADMLPSRALERLGVEVRDAKAPLEIAKSIKSPYEVEVIKRSMSVCSDAITFMREHAVPGVTENYLLSLVNQFNIEHGGEYQETRLLVSGQHTNPWFTETSDKVVTAGEMLVFDSDLIGPDGIFTDQTRSFVIGDGHATDRQRHLYSQAHEQLMHNIGLLKPGLEFSDFIDKSWKMHDIYLPNRYAEMVHGIGFGVEFPVVYYPDDAATWQYNGRFEAGMTVCVESYIGKVGAEEGVKLEQPILITEQGPVPLSNLAFEEHYL
ncbi:Xaa-Pro aminopeptidase [Pseudomonas sp. JUb42]|jgi:Xaa-Pro aminopeptidase|uniref:M24 family metallopeptidase n=1 Tax=Pseudomonas sp. JUb42 TaxID=2940611 RepID=UPI002167111F|nr:Xaa-Pro peptidase family protein [Pseudomonas sp. JUb42]MCS3470114.1 Xaa-Pro aminopeptidase [Pseudomonas sp. JUb42]